MPSFLINGVQSPSTQVSLDHAADSLIGGSSSPVSPPFKDANWPPHILNHKLHSADQILLPLDRVFELITNTRSAPGYDNITYKILKLGWDFIKDPLGAIFKDCIVLGAVPAQWLASKGVLLKKPGQIGDHPKHYRTISLLPTPWKMLGKLIQYHLRADCNFLSLLHPLQFGFVPCKGTDLALSAAVAVIESTLIDKEFCVGISVDIQGAFDNVNVDQVIQCLRLHNCPPPILELLDFYLHHRHTTLTLDDCSTTRYDLEGVPQGDTLAADEWDVTTTEILHTVNAHEYLQADCDDFLGLTWGNDLLALIPRAQWILDSIIVWCTKMGLSVSPIKTKAIIFTQNKKFPPQIPPLLINGSPIPFVASIEYLGVTLDCKLNWNKHIDKICGKATRLHYAMEKLHGVDWGSSPETLRYIHDRVIVPMVTYASHLFSRVLDQEGKKSRLDSITLSLSRSCTHSSKTAPKAAIIHIAGLTPMSTKITEQANKILVNNNIWTEHKPTKGKLRSHTEILPSSIKDSVRGLPIDKLDSPIYFPTRSFYTILEPVNHDPSNYDIVAYTDGSKSDNLVGFAWHASPSASSSRSSNILQESSRLPEFATISQAELIAIGRAARGISDYLSFHPRTSVVIYTDSQSSIRVLSALSTKSAITASSFEALNSLGLAHETSLIYCPAHTGIAGNERADQMAKEGSKKEIETAIPTPLPKAHVKRICSDLAAISASARVADMRTKCISTNSLLDCILNLNFQEESILRLSREELHLITHFLTNRGTMGCFRHRTDPAMNPTCRYCHLDPETNQHILFSCPALRMKRHNHFGLFILHRLPDSLSPVSLLRFLNAIDFS
eukprot:sb/3462065/